MDIYKRSLVDETKYFGNQFYFRPTEDQHTYMINNIDYMKHVVVIGMDKITRQWTKLFNSSEYTVTSTQIIFRSDVDFSNIDTITIQMI